MMQPVFAEPVIILVTESLHSSQTVKILAVWFTVVGVWIGIYFILTVNEDHSLSVSNAYKGKRKQVSLFYYFFVFALFVSPYVEYRKFSQCSRENNA